MRCFVAIPVPDECSRRLGATQAALGERLDGIRWTRAEGIHLTLCFLGEIDEATRSRLSDRLAVRVPGLVPRFRVRVLGLGTFPSLRRARVLWSGLVGEGPEAMSRLTKLHAAVREEALASDCVLEERAFSPHLTLGRFTRPCNPRILGPLLEAYGAADHGTIEAGSIRLYRSLLGPGGARYSVLGEYAL